MGFATRVMTWLSSTYAVLFPSVGIQMGTATTSARLKSPAPVAMGSGTTVDGSLGCTFTKSISSNTTISIDVSTFRDGEWFIVWITVSSGSPTITFTVTSGSVNFPGATAPVMSASGKTDGYIFQKISSSVVRGWFIQNYSA